MHKAARHKTSIPKQIKYIVGVDEVGRGPLAGPLCVGAVMAPINFKLKVFRKARDSKKMTAVSREFCFKEIKMFDCLRFSISFISPESIDRIGLTRATQMAINRSLRKLKLTPRRCLILLDGGLRASKKYIHQETIIKGDDKVKVISLASIVAKVARDRKLIRLHKLYPSYNFHKHKGYGTAEHLRLIHQFGISPIHRLSFLKKMVS